MSNYTTESKGLNIHVMCDIVGEEVWYKDIKVGVVDSQSFDGETSDFVIRYDTGELAEMMKDKCITVTSKVEVLFEDYEDVFDEEGELK